MQLFKDKSLIYFLKYQRMRLTKTLKLLLFISFLDIVANQAVTTPSKIDARVKVLYTNSSALVNHQFTFPIGTSNFSSIPSFGYGINDFKFYNSLAHVNFQSQAINLTSNYVTILMTATNRTNIIKVSINYISIWEYSGIFVISKTYSNMTNLTFSSGSRYYQLYQQFSVTSMDIMPIHFLRGFFFTSNIASQIYINISITSVANYLVRISTNSDCIVRVVNLDILFYYTDNSTNSEYVLGGDTTRFSQTTANIDEYNTTMVNYTNTVFIIGLGGFFGFDFSNYYSWGWSLVNLVDNTATIQLNRSNLQNIYYSYFQIGYIVPIATPTQNQPPEKTNYIGIIVGLIVGVTVISVAVVAIVKVYFKTIVYVIPEKNDFRVLPSISF